MRSEPHLDTRPFPAAAVAADTPHVEEGPGTRLPFGRRLRRWLWHVRARQFMLLPVLALAVARRIGRKRRPVGDDGCELLLTARFDSKNWIMNHLGPLSASKECARVWMVTSSPFPELPKVVGICPPAWLVRMVGRTPARLLVFLTMAVRKRPHIIGGFHIMFNGIAAIILARLVGSRSMYFCTGGPAEVRDGGIHSADSLFAPMETPDPVVQRRFLKILADVDVAITMGTGAVRYFRDQGIDADFHVIAGGIDGTRFRPAEEAPLYDLIMTGRLVPVKRIDVFLRAVRHVADRMPAVKAVVVGDGRLREALQALSVELGIGQNVRFAGHQEDVAAWLRRSKVFVLSSDSEGLSLSLMEAMMCGLPAVVSAVGDLADLVKDGVNGYLVPRRSPQVLADRLVELLSDTGKWEAFARAARHAALPYEAQATVRRWDHILAACRQGQESGVLSAKPMRG